MKEPERSGGITPESPGTKQENLMQLDGGLWAATCDRWYLQYPRNKMHVTN